MIDEALGFLQFVVIEVSENSENPGLEIGAGLKLICRRQDPHGSFLNQVVGALIVLDQEPGEGMHIRQASQQFVLYV